MKTQAKLCPYCQEIRIREDADSCRWESCENAAAKWDVSQPEIGEGVDGSGEKIFVLQAARTGEDGRRVYVNERFATRAEAEAWIVHALA